MIRSKMKRVALVHLGVGFKTWCRSDSWNDTVVVETVTCRRCLLAVSKYNRRCAKQLAKLQREEKI